MPRVDVVVECPVHDSFRVQQISGMFDVPLPAKSREEFSVELPARDEGWKVGLIVGPSGSGKSSVARAAYGDAVYRATDWPMERAVVDSFGQLSSRTVIELLTAVGFSSPPAWVKPFYALSTGQRMRCDLARALAAGQARVDLAVGCRPPAPLVVFDEFTSVVDRQVAKACSVSVAKAVRSGAASCQFVAVTCHYDVARWLAADWVLDLASGQLTRRRLRRPRVEIQVYRCSLDAWGLFARHHYLSGHIHRSARCYLATWSGEPVAFAATLPLIGGRRRRRFTRIVTLPDYQGMGIGMKFIGAVAELHRREGLRINVTSSHPALLGHCRRSKRWKTVAIRKAGPRRTGRGRFVDYQTAASRAVASFEYVGSASC